jgi:hypothetical protein
MHWGVPVGLGLPSGPAQRLGLPTGGCDDPILTCRAADRIVSGGDSTDSTDSTAWRRLGQGRKVCKPISVPAGRLRRAPALDWGSSS